jgi:PAS domain S-box-containing protein
MDTGLRLLIIEEDVQQAEIIAREFKNAGLLGDSVRVNSIKGFTQALANKPDLIIANYFLPAFDALKALAYLKEHHSDIPVIVLSGSLDSEIAVACMKAGAADVIHSAHIFRLAASAREAIEKREQQRRTRRIEKALRFTKVAVDHAAVAIYWLNHEGRFSLANEAGLKLLDYTMPELSGLTIAAVEPNLVPEKWKALLKSMAAKHATTFESRLSTKSGQIIPAELTLNDYQLDNQDFVLCFARDISDRKRSEEEYSRLVIAIEQAAESIMITDIENRILYVNPAFERVTGYDKEEVLGQNPNLLSSGRHDADFYREIWTALMSGKSWHGHFINKRKDGSLFEEEASISPIKERGGQIVSYVAVKRDVTHEIDLQKQVYHAEKMDAIGRLAGGVAHDFNNLLTIINGYSELMIKSIMPSDPLYGHVQQIIKACARASTHTKQLLAFSRRTPMEQKVIDLNAILIDMVSVLKRLINENIDLVTRFKEGTGNIKADPAEVEQIIVNLVVNARDAMPKGGKLTIETDRVTLDEKYCRDHIDALPGHYMLLSVQDTGVGMNEETKARIFEPFFTTKDQGTGLGLPTVFGIVRQNKGHVECYSEEGKGTLFKIFLPQVSDAAADVDLRTVYDTLPRGKETILLVEDEEDVRILTARMLQLQGYKVIEAALAGEALIASERQSEPIDLLLTDVVMPQIGGAELAERLRKTNPDLKVLYMSGYASDVLMAHENVDRETVSFIAKPFTLEKITQKVRDVLDQK